MSIYVLLIGKLQFDPVKAFGVVKNKIEFATSNLFE